jgi:hypothetical protein
VIQIIIKIDPIEKTITVTVYIKIPLLPAIKIGHITGKLKDGVKIEYNNLILRLKATLYFYVKDGWLWLKFSVTWRGRTWKGDIRLIPLRE